MNRKVMSVVLACILSSIWICGCGKKDVEVEAEEETFLPVDTMGAERGTLVIAESFIGSVSAERELKIYPKTSGEVTRLNVKTGDYVNAGDILFELDDKSAQLELKSAQNSLNLKQAQVNKELGSDQGLTEQKERQALENDGSKIYDRSYSLNKANENYDRERQYLYEAQEKESGAYDDFSKASHRYDKAKGLLDEYEMLQRAEPAFFNVSLTAAAAMTPTASGPTWEHVAQARSIYERCNGGEYDKLDPASISVAGVQGLMSARDSAYDKYESSKSAREGQEDKVTGARKTAEEANKALYDGLVTYRQDAENIMMENGAVLNDSKKIKNIEINSQALAVESARQKLEQYIVTSPISGYISKVDIREYDNVNTGTVALQIENTDTMTVEFTVTEKVLRNLADGQEVMIEKDDEGIRGSIIEINEAPDEKTGMFKIKAGFPGNSGILSGTRVTVTLDSYRDDSGFILPNDAIYRSNGQAYVYVAENGVAVKKNVTTGMFDADRIVVSDGINEGDRVITSWSSALEDGVKIKENSVENTVVINDAPGEDEKQAEGTDNSVSIDVNVENKDVSAPEDTASNDASGHADRDGESIVRATTVVFVRSAPNKDDNGNKLGKAKEGDEFTALGSDNGWTRILYNGSEAYIKSEYLAEVKVSDKGAE
jgi:RND family efflux transporter MFP subunit